MSEKYKDVRANDMYVGTSSGELRVTKESQLDRVEKKVDRILHILDNGELSTSFVDVEISTSNNNNQPENKTLILQTNKGNVERSWLENV